MAAVIGKRKRRDQVDDIQSEPNGNEEHTARLQALFRKHFEANYQPLEILSPLPAPQAQAETQTLSEEDGSDWEGLSDEEVTSVTIIDHASAIAAKPEMPKEERKTFMTTKPPSILPNTPSTTKKALQKPNTTTSETPASETSLLKHDLALQRLLQESHLLSPASSSLAHTGAARHKALDLRVQALGAKTSILKQEKMPMAQRKGMEKKALQRQGERRKEARENGIVLEKEANDKGKRKERKSEWRERGVGAPAVGAFRGGTLVLSRRDVESIEGVKGGGGRGGGRGGRRGGRGRGGGGKGRGG